jgi:hypothetical protein
MNNTLTNGLCNAFKKLKSHLFNDKTLLYEKIELARFEENLKANIDSLVELIISNNFEIILSKIDYTLVIKKLTQDEQEPNIYTNKTVDIEYKVGSYNIFIKAPIEIHLISTLWTMTVGEQLDKQLIDNTKGNRLFRDKQMSFIEDNYKLFKPYFEGYQSFRDDAIEMAISLHQKNLDVTFVNLDITEFYYNIPFDFTVDLSTDLEDKFSLNSLMQKIHTQFHTIVAKDNLEPKKNTNYNQNNFLPIGLVSSSVIANFVLQKFDNDIVDNLKPEYYSRYVDDMLLVFSNTKVKLHSETIICDLLKCKTVDTDFECISEENDKCKKEIKIILKTDKREFLLQGEKVKIFQFEKNDSIIVLEKFKETIDKNSSFFNFMPDDKRLFKTLESSGNILFYSDSENKISSITGTVKDTLKISRNMTGVISTVSYAKFDNEHFADYIHQLKNMFKGRNIFELKLHWEKLFEYFNLTNSKLLFEFYKEEFHKGIQQLTHNSQQDRLREDTFKYLENCIKFASAINNNILFSKADTLNETEDDISIIRKANMFAHHNMSYPLLNFCQNTTKFDFLTHNIEKQDFSFKMDKKKITNSPRFIHYHEVALFYLIRSVNMTPKNKSQYLKFINKYYIINNSLHDIENKLPTIIDDTFVINSDTEDKNKEKLRIAIVSMKINLRDVEKSYQGKPNLSYEKLQGIFNILNESIINKELTPDILIFPEVSIPYAWTHLMARFAKKNNIGIVFGIEHIKIQNRVSNYTCVMLPFKSGEHTSLFVNFDLKKHYSPNEKMEIEGLGLTVQENRKKDKPTLYKWRGSVFTTFNCYELTDINLRSNLAGKIDFMIAIEYNKDVNYFSNIIESVSRDIHCYIIQVNTSDYGDSRIVRPTKTDIKDIIKIKGGKNLYLVIDDIDIQRLREFQSKDHCLQMQEQKKDNIFKLTPPNYQLSALRNTILKIMKRRTAKW